MRIGECGSLVVEGRASNLKPYGIRGVLCVPDGKFYANVFRYEQRITSNLELRKSLRSSEEYDFINQGIEEFQGRRSQLLHPGQGATLSVDNVAAHQTMAIENEPSQLMLFDAPTIDTKTGKPKPAPKPKKSKAAAKLPAQVEASPATPGRISVGSSTGPAAETPDGAIVDVDGDALLDTEGVDPVPSPTGLDDDEDNAPLAGGRGRGGGGRGRGPNKKVTKKVKACREPGSIPPPPKPKGEAKNIKDARKITKSIKDVLAKSDSYATAFAGKGTLKTLKDNPSS